MRIMIIGSLGGALGQAARMAIGRGARLEQADTVEAALGVLRGDAAIALIFCDIGHDIGRLIQTMTAERITVPVIACGVDPEASVAVAAIRAGARDFLPLPPDAALIAAMLESVSADSHVMVVRDPVMAALIRRAEQVAPTEASILITGPSGTGKEVLARHIHRRSRRSAGPFVAVNCAAIPEALLESELFGHEKGAFSGAIARRVGKFEAADGGTLLLDEISEMDVRVQAKLLRVLQEREVDRLGGTSPVKVDVRILATSNRDLPATITQGGFREDLYFRLNVVNLRIPALRERSGDIAALAEHFARHFGEVNGLPARRLTEAAQRRLLLHEWRGNVRELENTVHRAVLLADGEAIDVDAIELVNERASAEGADREASAHGPAQGLAAGGFVGQRMEDIERTVILQTLSHTSGNRTHAAVILGISIRALRNKLRDYSAQGVAVPPPSAGLGAPYIAGTSVGVAA